MNEIARGLGRVEGTLESLVTEFRDHRASTRASHDMIKTELRQLGRRVSRLERKKPPRIETITKRALTWGLPTATFIATGSAETAVEVLKAVLGVGR